MKKVFSKKPEGESKERECFNPNNDPYPLCKGGREKCEDCCIYENYEEYHNPNGD